jgi:putative ABC transport system permease protein
MADLIFAFRSLRRVPAFALTVVAILAISIGGNTAMFTIIRSVLLKPLEYRDPDRLVYFSTDNAARNVHDGSFSRLRLDQIRNSAQSFESSGAFLHSREEMTLSGGGDPEPVKGARVSANFLDILGVKPIAGRGFIAAEDQSGGPYVAMISESLWRSRFHADREIAGKIATIDAIPYAIVGVLPAGFDFPMAGVDVWVPRPWEWSILASRYWNGTSLNGFARLKPGVSVDQARAEMTVLNEQYKHDHPNPLEHDSLMRVVWLKDRLISGVRVMLWTLSGAVAMVLLIACANVAGLLMARAHARSREFAVRASLGAPRSRLVSPLMAESVLLSLAGGAIGLLLAKWTLHAIRLADVMAMSSPTMPLIVPGAGAITLDSTVLASALALSILTAVLFGLAPAWSASRPDLADALRAAGEGAARSTRTSNLPRSLLVIAQIAMSVTLLTGAGLLMRSFLRLRSIDVGFNPSHLLTMKIALPPARYDTPQKRFAFFSDAVSRVEAIPGVRDAAMVTTLPTTTWIRTNVFGVEGRAPVPEDDPSSFAVWQSVTADYFRTLGLRLQRGRFFGARDDRSGAPPVMIINETLARALWPEYPNVNVVGRHMGEGYDKLAGQMEVVGVVADVREGGLAHASTPEFYVTSAVHPPQTAFLTARTAADPLELTGAIRAQILAIDSAQAVSDVRTMEDVLEASIGQRRLALSLLGGFAGVALLLAVVGIYGVIAYSVSERTKEVGIRRALGAETGDILRMVLGQTLTLASGGVAIGIAAAFALTGLLRAMLFGITATDPATFITIAAVFLIAALAAGAIPAWRATRIDPMSALR